MRKFLSATLAVSASLMAAKASATQVVVIPTEGTVQAVVATQVGSFIQTQRGTFRLDEGECLANVCITADVIRGLPQAAPAGALPDGKIATADQGDIRRAWYGRPTDRYAHAVLGDAIEAGSLVVETTDGAAVELVLPDAQVFEDITPRIFDLDGNGENEVITIRASQTGGAAVLVYGLEDGALVERAASSENGQRNRWLNIAHIEDGALAFVRTPHIGGRLSVLRYNGPGAFQEINDLYVGVSNHLIGSRELDLSEPFEAGAITGIALPSQNRDKLVFVRTGDDVTEVALPGKVDKAIIAVGNTLVTATENGALIAIKP
ncbi:MAG: hypothetical protein AAFR13_06480 [Pseudomonadota bacterium]